MNLNREVFLLDCTLRDGGHLNNGYFGKEVIKGIIEKLYEARIDIIEIGFLWKEYYGEDIARFHSISEVKRILPEKVLQDIALGQSHSKFSLMADYVDVNHLEPCDGTIEIIRLSFKRHRLEWALNAAQILMKKGYKVFINPVNCNVYTEEQYLDVIRQVNKLHPYGFSIVDTFGVMRVRDLSYQYGLAENNLYKDIQIGLHLHENLGLAYSLAQEFLKISSPTRDIVIDGSLLGMGRVPGNLCIDQIMEHLNYEYGASYKTEPAFDAIDDYIAPIKNMIPWGYAIPFALSAKYGLHRTYAEFLLKKWKLRTSDIERILTHISHKEAELFNEEYIENLYREYMDIKVDDTLCLQHLKDRFQTKKVLLIAPGASINRNKNIIRTFCDKHTPVIIGIHCIPDFISVDYEFFSNIKRLDVLRINDKKIVPILTSNLTRYSINYVNAKIIDYSSLSNHEGVYCDDSVLMVLNLLKRLGIDQVNVAGFDGIKNGKGDFYIDSLSRTDRPNDYSEAIKRILISKYNTMKINFITESLYESKEDKKEMR